MGFEGHGNTLLMSCQGVSETHGHHNSFPESERSKGRGVLNVIGVHQSLKEGIGHVKFSPEGAFSTVSQDIVYMGKWIVVGDGDAIECPEVVNPLRQDWGLFHGQ